MLRALCCRVCLCPLLLSNVAFLFFPLEVRCNVQMIGGALEPLHRAHPPLPTPRRSLSVSGCWVPEEEHRTAQHIDVPLAQSEYSEDSNECRELCQCVSVVETLYRSSEHVLCVEYASAVLEMVQPNELSLDDALTVLRCLASSFIRLSEIERSRTVLQLWGELLDAGRHHLRTPAERHRWQLRLHRCTADLCTANGEREEAVQELVHSWRIEAYLHGPESLVCVKTYLRIAELKIELMQDTEAYSMLQHATAMVRRPERDVLLWCVAKRLFGVVAERQQNFAAAVASLSEAVNLLRGATDATALDRVDVEGVRSRSLSVELAACLMCLAELQLRTVSSSSAERSSALETFEEGVAVLRDCMPPTSHPVVRARLRHAALVASSPTLPLRRISTSPSATTSPTRSRTHAADMTYYHRSLLSAASKTSSKKLKAEAADAVASLADPHAALRCAHALVSDVLDELNQGEVRGARHLHVLVEVYEALGDLERRLGDHRAAATSFHKAKAAAGQLFAADHERCALLQHRLAEELLVCGHWEDASHLLKELHEWCLLCPSGHMPPVPLVVLNHSLGSAMRLGEKFDEAERYFLAALQDPSIDFFTASKVLGNMAALQLTRGDIDGALVYNRQALTLRVKNLGEVHDDVAASYANLAAMYQRKGNTHQALFHANKCLETIEALKQRRASNSSAVRFAEDMSKVKAWAIRTSRHV